MAVYRPDKIQGREYVAVLIDSYEYNPRYDHVPLNPTGRWYLEFFNTYYVMYVEHKCGLFKRRREWIPEGLICYKVKENVSPIYGGCHEPRHRG